MAPQEPGSDVGDFVVRIGPHRFDPAETVDPADLVAPGAGGASARSGAPAAGGPADTRLVQFFGPLTAEEMDRLRDAYGLALTSYYPPWTYVERVPAEVRPRLAADPAVRAVAPFLARYKLAAPPVEPGAEATRSVADTPNAGEPVQVTYVVGLFDGGDAAAVVGLVERSGARDVAVCDDRVIGGNVRVVFVAPAGFDLALLAGLPDVQWAAAAPPPTSNSMPGGRPADRAPGRDGAVIAARAFGGNVAAASVHQSGATGNPTIWAPPGGPPGNPLPGLHGEGQIISVTDDGAIDRYHQFLSDFPPTPGPPASPGPPVPPGLNHRKIQEIAFPTADPGDDHATKVAGIAVGDDRLRPGLDVDRGGAYAARVVSNDYNRIPFLSSLFNEINRAHVSGARIHSNSWDDKYPANHVHYEALCQDVDRFTHQNEEDLYVVSCPNTGDEAYFPPGVPPGLPAVISPPELAKNTVCVAATQSPTNPAAYESGTLGPTFDNRRKPDLVAIGGGLDAPRARHITPRVEHFLMSVDVVGTSFATPHVAAAAALIRQYFTEGYYPSGLRQPAHAREPSGAVMKAMLIASCGNRGGALGPYPNDRVGWGLLQLDRVLPFVAPTVPPAPPPPPQQTMRVVDVRNVNGCTTGRHRVHRIHLAPGGPPLKVVLAYSDAPANVNANPTLVNNLNLRVTAPRVAGARVLYRGNDIDPVTGLSRPDSNARDDRNPLEVVHIANPAGGVWDIEVEATAVNAGPQGYALVILGEVTRGPDPAPTGLTIANAMEFLGRAVQFVLDLLADTAGGGNRSGGAARAAVAGAVSALAAGDGLVDLVRARELFAELGLPDADTVLSSGGVVDALAGVVAPVIGLPAVLDALVGADAGGDAAALVEAVEDVGSRLRGVAGAVDALAVAFDAAAEGGGADDLRAFAAELPGRFFGYALATYLEHDHRTLAGLAKLFGVVESVDVPATEHTPAHVRRHVRFKRVGEALTDPLGVLASLYGWGSPDLDAATLFDRLVELFAGLETAFVEPDPETGAPVLRLGPLGLTLTPDAPLDGGDGAVTGSSAGAGAAGASADAGGSARALSGELAPGIRARLAQELPPVTDVRVPLGSSLAVELALQSTLESDATIDLRPPARLVVTPPSASELGGVARIGISATGVDGRPLVLVGKSGGSRIETGELRMAVGAQLAWSPDEGVAAGAFLVEAAIHGGRAVLSLAGADTFLAALLPANGLALDFELLVRWSDADGLTIDGGAGLAIDLPAGFTIGPVKVTSLHLGLVLDPTGLGFEASGAVAARLGPFSIDIEPMGALGRLAPAPGGGNLGPADFDVDFRPPAGLGMSLNAGIVKGGGFLYHDETTHEYAGALELALGPISIKAIGILTTDLPDDAEGWALLLLVFSEFKGIQLGFGFTLDGVGGIIGLQHGVATPVLQSGLRSGVADGVLFPPNPVRDAPALLDRLRTVFPIVPRALTVGPTLKIGWGSPSLVTIKLGLILQFDDVLGAGGGPASISQLVLLGQLVVQAPPRRRGSNASTLLQLKVDLIGVYDFNEKSLAIDAVLYDSHLAFASLGGTMVVRARFGERPNLIVAVGGFHPRFQDIPPGIPPQERLGLRLSYGPIRVEIVGYVALTTNSFQFGASASLVARAGNFQVRAYLGFDALFVLAPVFRFEIDFRLGASITWKSWTIAAVHVAGSLSGPGRWSISGKASLTILFFTVRVRFHESWGPTPTEVAPTTVDARAALIEAASAAGAWSATLLDGDPLVTLTQPALDAGMVAHPLSSLVMRQTEVPLGVAIDRIGEARTGPERTFTIEGAEVGGRSVVPRPVEEHFARGQFFDLDEEQRLSTPSFERFDAGAAVTPEGYTTGTAAPGFDLGWETAYHDHGAPNTVASVATSLLEGQTSFSPAARSELGGPEPDAGLRVTVTDPGYVVGTGESDDAVRAWDRTTAVGRPDGPVPLTYTLARQRARAEGATVSQLAEVVTR